MYKPSTSPFSSQNLHYQIEYHITARNLPHQVVCCPKECSVGSLSLRLNFDLGFFNFLRLDIYIWIGKSICLETETKDVGICKVSEQLQVTIVTICSAGLVPQEQLVEMIPGFQFSFRKYCFYAYILQASLHPKLLYSSFIWVSGTLFSAPWTSCQAVNNSNLVWDTKPHCVHSCPTGQTQSYSHMAIVCAQNSGSGSNVQRWEHIPGQTTIHWPDNHSQPTYTELRTLGTLKSKWYIIPLPD